MISFKIPVPHFRESKKSFYGKRIYFGEMEETGLNFSIIELLMIQETDLPKRKKVA